MGGTVGNQGSPADSLNIQQAHEQLFFCNNGRVIRNIGYGTRDGGPVGPGFLFSYTPTEINSGSEVVKGKKEPLNFVVTDPELYNIDVIDIVLRSVPNILPDRCIISTDTYRVVGNNCQDFAKNVRKAYWQKMFIGTWIGNGYSCEQGGLSEKVKISISGKSLVAKKNTGDNCVPAGNIAFQGTIPNSVSKGSSFSVTVTIGSPDNPASATTPAKLTILNANSFSIGPVKFTRTK
jgi:hypothetical protein